MQNQLMRNEYYTVPEYAKKYEVTSQTVRLWIRSGKLRAVKGSNGRYIIVKKQEGK